MGKILQYIAGGIMLILSSPAVAFVALLDTYSGVNKQSFIENFKLIAGLKSDVGEGK